MLRNIAKLRVTQIKSNGIVTTRGLINSAPLKINSYASIGVRSFSSNLPIDGKDAASSISDVVSNSEVVTAIAGEMVPHEKTYMVAHFVMETIESVHTMIDVPYWEAIVLTTIGLRFLLIPVVLKTIQSSSRMAVMKPEMEKIQAEFKNTPDQSNPVVQQRFQNEMQALFKKHNCNPFRAMLWPLFQFPIFISFFMGLRDMINYYPDFATGGALWFVNLGAADATYAWPIINSLTFLIMLEMGSDGMQVNQQQTFKWAMRGIAGVMVPLTATLPQGVFVYWAANNVFSITQTLILKYPPLRKALAIPDIPKPSETKPLKVRSPLEMFKKQYNEAVDEATKVEILDGQIIPKPPSDIEKPKTFATKPPKTKTKSSKK